MDRLIVFELLLNRERDRGKASTQNEMKNQLRNKKKRPVLLVTEAPLPKIKRNATSGMNLTPRSAPACDVGEEARLSCGIATVPTLAVDDDC